MGQRSVAIVHKFIPDYRVPFYSELLRRCAAAEIDLSIIYGDGDRADRTKGYLQFPAFGRLIRNKLLQLGDVQLVWQPAFEAVRGKDLVIAPQHNKFLVNYLFLARQAARLQKFAFWGQGHNPHAHNPNSASEALKRKLLRLPHWWFAYTEGTAKYLRAAGFPAERITVVQNAIDTSALTKIERETTPRDLDGIRERLNTGSENICLYVGAMYREKRLEFLMEACDRVKRRVDDFHMVFVGAGPDEGMIRDYCAERRWTTYHGRASEEEKIRYGLLAKLMLMPGSVGLVVLDSLALGLPLVTTDVRLHGPEIEYLEDGITGAVVSPGDDIESYADRVAALLERPAERAEMARRCRDAGRAFTIEEMAERFFTGITEALDAPPRG
jgi:glycosyltransferase involved in cell wall biosynthesis